MAKPSFIPNLKKAAPKVAPKEVVEEVEEIEEEIEEEVEELDDEVEETEEGEEKPKKKRKKSDKDRKTPNRQMTNEDMQFVIENIKNMTYTEIGEARGITKFQVNRVLMEVKKNLRAQAEGDEEKMAKVEAYIKQELSRPEDSFGGGGRGSAVKEGIDNIVDSIIANI